MTTQQEALQAAQWFGVSGALRRLSGEYDANYAVQTEAGAQYVLKISHPDTLPATIALQNAVLSWLAANKVPFAIPIPKKLADGSDYLLLNGALPVRLFHYVPGELLGQLPEHSAHLLTSFGTQLGLLSKALASFEHPAAKRPLQWDFKQTDWVYEKLSALNPAQQAQLLPFLQHFKTDVAPRLATLRHSIIHGDLNDYNVVTHDNVVTGFIDFGDVVETATISELAIALTYALLNKADPFACATLIIKAYHAQFPLQPDEINLLYDLIAMRLCMSVVNSAERKRQHPADPYLTISEAPAWDLLSKWHKINPKTARTLFYQACGLVPEEPLSAATATQLRLRKQLIGKNVSLSYDQPIQIVRGEGQYLFDEQGKRYLDGVNNVCHVGHCHPDVVAAGQAQMALLNTNTRYLNAALTDYATRLLATFPKSLSVCFFVCSGSEANELALRLAKVHTKQHRIAVLDHGYHGNTDKLVQISPYKFNGKGGEGKPDFVDVLPIPDPLRVKAVKPILTQGVGAFIAESLLSCGGQVVLPPGFLADIYAQVRALGGVCIADEVQVGLGRIGSHFWGFESQQVVPDIVTLGKPLGNGHPIGAVITTPAIAESFCNGMEYFNTFGGNPVSCRIGLSVLDVLEKEQLQAHAQAVGDYLKQQLQDLATKRQCIGDVRGLGLFLGVELVEDNHQFIPAPKLAKQVVNQLKVRGILLSSDGPYDNVLKIKPPLVFSRENADTLVAHLAQVLP